MRRRRRSIRRRSKPLQEDQMDPPIHYARHLLLLAIRPLEPRSERAKPSGAGRSHAPQILFLLHRNLAPRGLIPHRSVDPRGVDLVLDERPRGTHLVRLSLPADGLDRSLPLDGAPFRRRPARAHDERRRTVDGATGARVSTRRLTRNSIKAWPLRRPRLGSIRVASKRARPMGRGSRSCARRRARLQVD